MIAESRPEEKDIMIKLVVNLINDKNYPIKSKTNEQARSRHREIPPAPAAKS